MNIKKHKNNRKNNLILALVVFVASIGFCVLYSTGSLPWQATVTPKASNSDATSNTQNAERIDNNPPTSNQTTAGDNIKKESVDNNRSNSPSLGLKVVVSPPLISDSDNTLRIQTTITPIISTGSCTLTLTQGSIKKIFTAEIQPLTSYATCKGFSISIANNNLTPGLWSVRINVTSRDLSGSTSTSVNI